MNVGMSISDNVPLGPCCNVGCEGEVLVKDFDVLLGIRRDNGTYNPFAPDSWYCHDCLIKMGYIDSNGNRIE